MIPHESKKPPALTRRQVRECSILAIDHGEKRIGLAIRPAGRETVLPLCVIAGHPVEEAVQKIRTMIAERAIGIVVIGLPVHTDDRQAREVKRFARKLRAGIKGIRWRFADESLTTFAVRADRVAMGPDPRHAAPLDARAAALILETFLSSFPDP